MLHPYNVKIAEYQPSELEELSGVLDEDTQRELTNAEFLDDYIGFLALDRNQLFVNRNGMLSPEANRHNSGVTRGNIEGEHMVALAGKRSPEITPAVLALYHAYMDS